MDAVLDRLAHRCTEAGLEAWEIFYLDRRASRITREVGGRLDRQVLHERGLGLRGGRGDRWAFASTSDLTPRGLEGCIDHLVRLIPLAPAEGPLRLASAGGEEASSGPGAPPELTSGEAEALLREAAGGEGSDRRCRYRWSRSATRVRNHLGLDVAFEHSRYTVAAQAGAGGPERRTFASQAVFARHPGQLDPRKIGEDAARMAADLARARRPTESTCSLVLSPASSATLLALLAPALAGSGDLPGRPPFRGLLGETVGSAALALADDPRHPAGFGNTPFDGEGTPTRPLTFVRRGILLAFAHDAASASRHGVPSTGHAVRNDYTAVPVIGFHNLHLEPGPSSAGEILARAGKGVYVQELWPGPQRLRGEGPTLEGWGYALCGGTLGEPLAPIRIHESPARLLFRLAEVAQDLTSLPGGVMGSTVLLEEVGLGPGGESRL